MKEYFVCRMANKQDGTVLNAVVGYEDEASAWKAYWKTLAIAIDANTLSDAVTIMTKGGFQLDYKGFEHEPEPVEPEGEEEG